MKKKLEADLISIAHRILQLKNKSDINQLYLESQKLYEKLSVLRFIDEHYGDVKPTIGHAEIEKEVQAFYDKSAELPAETIIEITESKLPQEGTTSETIKEEKSEQEIASPTIVAHLDEVLVEENTIEDSKTEESSPEVEEEVLEDNTLGDFEADIKEQPVTEEMPTDDVVISENEAEEEILVASEEKEEQEEEPQHKFKAAFELTDDSETEEIEIETPKKPEAVQISFEDLLGGNYNDTLFVKVDDVPALPPEIVFEAKETIVEKAPEPIIEEKKEKAEPKIVSLNDKLSKGIDIDLNDRIAFVKHLFGNNSEDYNRVLNQLITFDNFHETRNFIEEMVKPDYNNWKGKEDYEERFMDIIEKKFL
ncbi:hypothetical protein [Flavobacterium sp. WC2416]|jgi:hypothetical protein|uniref:DUF4476 domain-containing protein n=1 Tax=Flavobacterium sp. WC2416 TaxID=3234141 RepID=A0AB39WD34_9FLAO